MRVPYFGPTRVEIHLELQKQSWTRVDERVSAAKKQPAFTIGC